MSNRNSDMLNLLKNDADALSGIVRVIQYLGTEKLFQILIKHIGLTEFIEIYSGNENFKYLKDGKKNESDHDSYANDLFDQINNYQD
ncbi:MAG: hypothetical protein JXB49_08980 [Bacteroidales bacterium]|nr:hypothetical protein [Bacteroidales bacterium]